MLCHGKWAQITFYRMGFLRAPFFIAVPWFLSALLLCNHKHATFLIMEKKKTHKFFKPLKNQPALFLFLCSNTCSVMEITLRLFFPLAAYQFTDIACGCMKSQTHGFHILSQVLWPSVCSIY